MNEHPYISTLRRAEAEFIVKTYHASLYSRYLMTALHQYFASLAALRAEV